MTFDKFVVWSGELSLGEVCGSTLEKKEQFENVFVLVCYLNGKWLQKLQMLCEFIL